MVFSAAHIAGRMNQWSRLVWLHWYSVWFRWIWWEPIGLEQNTSILQVSVLLSPFIPVIKNKRLHLLKSLLHIWSHNRECAWGVSPELRPHTAQKQTCLVVHIKQTPRGHHDTLWDKLSKNSYFQHMPAVTSHCGSDPVRAVTVS